MTSTFLPMLLYSEPQLPVLVDYMVVLRMGGGFLTGLIGGLGVVDINLTAVASHLEIYSACKL